MLILMHEHTILLGGDVVIKGEPGSKKSTGAESNTTTKMYKRTAVISGYNQLAK